MADDIVQRIVLTGDDDITRAFDQIAEAGERAAHKLEEAFSVGITSAEGIGLAIGGAIASLGLLTAAAAEFTRRMAEVVDSTKDLAQQLGITTEEMSGLGAAFADSGISNGQMEQSFRRLTTVIQNSWDQIKKASADSADKLKGDAIGVAQAQEQLANAQTASARLERDQSDARIRSSQSVASAELRLRDSQLALARSRGADTSVQDAALSRARQQLAVQEAQQALRDAQLKKSREAEDQAAAARKQQLAEEKAGLDLDQARKKQREDQANDIGNITAAIKKVNAGDTDALKSINASAENVVKGIVAASADGGKALVQFKGDISDLATPAPRATAVLETLGKTLAAIKDPILQGAVAARFFGRTVSEDMIQVLANPDKLDAFKKRIDDLGLGISKVDVEIAEKFRSALFTLQNDFQLVGVKIASVFGPTFTQILEDADKTLLSLKDTAVDVIKGFDAGPVKLFISALESLGNLGSSSLKLVGQLLNGIASAVNAIFGTDFTGFTLALSPVIAALKTVQFLVDAIAGSFRLLSSFFSGQGFGDRISALTELLGKQMRALGEFVTGNFKKGIEDFNQANTDYAKRLTAIDSVEKQVAEGQAKRRREMSDDTEKSNDNITTDQKKSLDEADGDYKKSVDNRLEDQKRLESAAKTSNDQTQKAQQSQRKAAQSDVSTPDLSGPGGIIGGGGQLLRQIFDKVGGPFTINGVSVGSGLEGETIGLGRGVPIGFGSGASVGGAGKPELDQSIIDAQRGNQIAQKVLSDAVKQGIQGAAKEATPQRPFSVAPDSRSPTGIPTGEPFPQLPLPERPPLADDLRPPGVNPELQSIADKLDSFLSTMQSLFQKLSPPPSPQGEQLPQTDGLGQPLSDAASSIGAVGDNADKAQDSLSKLVDAANSAASALNGINKGSSDSGSNVVELAGGGHITGPGTSTSDSIPAWLSTDEFVHPAMAVRHYGLSFMESIRNLSFPKFSTGGLANLMSSSIPRFSGGGVVSSQGGGFGLPDLGTVSLLTDHGRVPVIMSRDAATELHRRSVNQRISSTTKKTPGFVS